MAETRKKSSTRKPGPGRPWPKGVSGNPGGRPRLGTSYAEAVRAIGEMSPEAMAKRAKAKDLTMRESTVIQMFLAFHRDPTAAMFSAIANRAEGMPPQAVDVNWRQEAEKQGVDVSRVFEAMVQAASAELDRANDGGRDGGGKD